MYRERLIFWKEIRVWSIGDEAVGRGKEKTRTRKTGGFGTHGKKRREEMNS